MKRCLLLLLFCGWAGAQGDGQAVLGRSTLGIEGEISFSHRGPELVARASTDEDRLFVRIIEVQRAKTVGEPDRYRIAFLATKTGRFDLRDELVTVDDQAPDAVLVPPLIVEVTEVTPVGAPLGFIPPAITPSLDTGGPPRTLLIIAGVVWILPLCVWLLRRRRRGEERQVTEAPAEGLSLEAMLRPLVREAAAGRLTAAGKARLERLLIGHWRGRLDLPLGEGLKTLEALKAHPEAGELLLAIERWLHQKAGATLADSEIERLLAPYARAHSEVSA